MKRQYATQYIYCNFINILIDFSTDSGENEAQTSMVIIENVLQMKSC